jgi:hypothetical protein
MKFLQTVEYDNSSIADYIDVVIEGKIIDHSINLLAYHNLVREYPDFMSTIDELPGGRLKYFEFYTGLKSMRLPGKADELKSVKSKILKEFLENINDDAIYVKTLYNFKIMPQFAIIIKVMKNKAVIFDNKSQIFKMLREIDEEVDEADGQFNREYDNVLYLFINDYIKNYIKNGILENE